MRTRTFILVGLWLPFIIYWALSAMRAKRSVRGDRSLLWVRVLFVVLFAALFHLVNGFRELMRIRITDPVFATIGLVVCGLGLAFSSWARACLGRNWGLPMSMQEGAEIVMKGPYRLVRHPIYSGISLALLGSALVGGDDLAVRLRVLGLVLRMCRAGGRRPDAPPVPGAVRGIQKEDEGSCPLRLLNREERLRGSGAVGHDASTWPPENASGRRYGPSTTRSREFHIGPAQLAGDPLCGRWPRWARACRHPQSNVRE